ncbi:MAG: mannose-1-phosphate guanylyltransferase [Paludibacteraceae bacterium]|nr:mannose-1-phosphate guanylyltransferase [Paludibacteraceae bacterium]
MAENKNNYCVIMAGGIGSRFWPYSRQEKPKQFLDFFGTGRSLLQMTVDRFRPIVPIENVLIVTNVAYRDIILEQIPDMQPEQILCEPARRNTAPCIAYATAWIKARVESEKLIVDRSRLDESLKLKDVRIVVAASDHLILEEEKFRQTIRQAFEFVGENQAICTLGMQPTRPETGYGYIQFDELKIKNEKLKINSDGIFPVKEFKEKPNLETAKKYLESGDYLWNSGIFIWSLSTIQEALREHMPEVDAIFRKGEGIIGTNGERAWIEENFPKCPNISIDYGVMEKAKNVYVLPSSFGWSDLGTWGSLYELSEKDTEGNVGLHSKTVFHEAKGNIVVLEKGKTAIVQGVDDMIIVEEKGALLICKKAEEQRIKEWTAELGN